MGALHVRKVLLELRSPSYEAVRYIKPIVACGWGAVAKARGGSLGRKARRSAKPAVVLISLIFRAEGLPHTSVRSGE